jgi:UDP-GlcNAc:undecaprenyl-phosphate/decaprenyl-phosphate GlcNAc-1-phosphate transferase
LFLLFFFEKKNQKTFVCLALAGWAALRLAPARGLPPPSGADSYGEPALLFLLLAALSAAIVAGMIRVGTLDHPGARSSHSAPTPKGGGVGISAAYLAGMAWLAHTHHAPFTALPLMQSALLLAVVSYFDDVRQWPFLAKLAAQVVAAGLIATVFGFMIAHQLLGARSGLIWLGAVPILFGWLVYVTNAVNFIDGLNGLAAGSVAIAAAAQATSVPASIGQQGLVLVAGVIGFLPFNYPRARIFMGDVGSQVCGFVIAGLAIQAINIRAAALIVPLALLPILTDTAFTLLRRARRGDKLVQAHRGHLYQVANRAGMKAPVVTTLYWCMAAWGAACGSAAGRIGPALPAAIVAFALALLPMAAWSRYVVLKAKQAGITAW